MYLRIILGVAALAALLAGCSADTTTPAAEAPAITESGDRYVEITGGGFIFNYRIAETTAGMVAVPIQPLPEAAKLEASFENPAGGAPILLTQETRAAQTKYVFTTPPLQGVAKDRPYAVSLRVVGADVAELQKLALTYKSNVDQSVMPLDPLTVGPGYQEPVRDADVPPAR